MKITLNARFDNWKVFTIFCCLNYFMYISVPVTSVTLSPTPIHVTAGQQMYINCTTSYCYPPANIAWYMSSTNFTNQLTLTENNTSNGLVRTLSALSINASKSDNGKQVYCTASNISGRRINSTVNMVTVLCKYLYIYFLTTNYKRSLLRHI